MFYGTEEQSVISEIYHCAGFDYRYDERGNQNHVWYCGLDGSYIEPELFGVKMNYKIYDDYGNLTWDSYYHYDGINYQKAVRKDLGYFAVNNIYDKKVLTSREYLDEDEIWVINQSQGYASVDYTYDSQGRIVDETYYDQEGYIINCTKGYARIEYLYDDSGNEKERVYRDKREMEEGLTDAFE